MPVRLLHCHSTFSLGGKEARAVQLMNAFGDRARHTILSAAPDALGARETIHREVKAEFPDDAPSLSGWPSVPRYIRLVRYMRQFDLVLTYNWGAMDAVMARRLFGYRAPPLIHHEDGFNADEAVRLNAKRSAFRRAALGTAYGLVVPSQTLERIARDVWRQPTARLHRIPNGIDLDAFAKPPNVAISGFERRPGEIVVGTVAGLRAVKNLPRLVRAVAPLPNVRLVIVGEGPEREAITAEAKRTGMADRLVLPGFMPDPASYMGHFDIFALSSDSEQFPISLVEAMAAGLPVVSTAAGDVRAMVSRENAELITAVGNDAAYNNAMAVIAGDAAERGRLGRANRVRARTDYDAATMVMRYRKLYEGAMSRPDALT